MTEIGDLEGRAEGEQAGAKICPFHVNVHKIKFQQSCKFNKVLNIFIVEAGPSEKP